MSLFINQKMDVIQILELRWWTTHLCSFQVSMEMRLRQTIFKIDSQRILMIYPSCMIHFKIESLTTTKLNRDLALRFRKQIKK